MRDLVMPVVNGFLGRFVRIDAGQLRKRDGHFAALPSDEHEHVAGAGIFGREAKASTVSPFLRGEASFGVMHLAWNGKRILFSR